MGRLNATDGEIYEAAKKANAHEFICNLHDKYEVWTYPAFYLPIKLKRQTINSSLISFYKCSHAFLILYFDQILGFT